MRKVVRKVVRRIERNGMEIIPTKIQCNRRAIVFWYHYEVNEAGIVLNTITAGAELGTSLCRQNARILRALKAICNPEVETEWRTLLSVNVTINSVFQP